MTTLLLAGAAWAGVEAGPAAGPIAVEAEAPATDPPASTASTAPPPEAPPGTAAAFLVLGTTPTSIARPGTANDLAVSIGAASDAAGTFPFDYAVELRPYWLVHPAARRLTLRDYVSGRESIAQNALVSFGSTGATAGEGTPLRFAAAVQTTAWGRPAPGTNVGRFAAAYDDAFAGPASLGAAPPRGADACTDVVADLGEASRAMAAALAAAQAVNPDEARRRELFAELEALCATADPTRYPAAATRCVEADALAGPPPASSSPASAEDLALAARVDALVAARAASDPDGAAAAGAIAIAAPEGAAWGRLLDEAGYAEAQAACAGLLSRREGLAVDLALAAAWESADRTAADLELAEILAWVTPGWAWPRAQAYGIVRVHAVAPRRPEHAERVDLGLAAGRQWTRLTLTGQVLASLPAGGERTDTNPGATVGAAASVDVRLNDTLWFTTGLGATWPFDTEASLLASTGLRFGANTARTLALPTAPTLEQAALAPAP